MKKLLFITLLIITLFNQMKADNIFLSDFKTTNGAIPFDRIRTEDYEPAIMQAIKEHEQEVLNIANQSEAPTFENTILALEYSGKTLNRVLGVFYPMLSANADDSLIVVSNRISPIVSQHSNFVTLNEKLWQRISTVYQNFDESKYSLADKRLLDKVYRSFVRSGAQLQGEAKEQYKKLTLQLTDLTLKFSQNCLKEKPLHELWLKKEDLAGLPETVVEAAAADAKQKGKEGEYLITLYYPSYSPFMKYSSRRDLREKLYKMYNEQCTSGEYSNMEVVKQIANTRLAIANLMGYKTYADYSLGNTMAKDAKHVYDMLNQLKKAYAPVQKADMKRLQEFASKLEGKSITLMPWDYSYYANKEKEANYNVDDELLRPYFELNNVVSGVFGLATKLYGLQFTPNHDAQVFYPDVQVFDVKDENGGFVGMLYTDFFPRSTKRSGAWMTNFREQYYDESGKDVRPLVTLTLNFTKPTESKPSLLSFYEVSTFAHEFGHGLHSLLSNCKYQSLSGTNVYTDFVELPSQFNENYMKEREFLDGFAKHYLTGEKIPQDLVDRIIASSQYGAAYACMRQLNFGFLDMAWYTIDKPFEGDVAAFENKALKDVQLFDPVEGCLISPQFGHIFSGMYSAGYYSYKWAEVLDADAFSKFKENGIFDPATAKSFQELLSKGSTENPMDLYVKFRGREPKIDALLKRDGIVK